MMAAGLCNFNKYPPIEKNFHCRREISRSDHQGDDASPESEGVESQEKRIAMCDFSLYFLGPSDFSAVGGRGRKSSF